MGERWTDILSGLLAGKDLDYDTAYWVMDQIMTGAAGPVRVSAFLTGLAAKGESVQEIRGLADSMQSHALPLHVSSDALDIVGTGGDRANTANISTMASLVIAASGVPVVKHGNRAATSACGSADVIEALGINLDAGTYEIAAIFEKVGMAFCFANLFHPSMRYAAPVRRELGIPTAFNILGPLTNPANPRASAVGVYNQDAAALVAGVLAERGSDALVFRGRERGLDELTTTEVNEIWEITDGQIHYRTLDAVKVFGLAAATVEDLRGSDAAGNAQIAREVFAARGGAMGDAVALNAAAGIVAYGRTSAVADRQIDLETRLARGLEIAFQTIESGRVNEFLGSWIAASCA